MDFVSYLQVFSASLRVVLIFQKTYQLGLEQIYEIYVWIRVFGDHSPCLGGYSQCCRLSFLKSALILS